jgi:Starch-binding associating with outer membrane
MKQIKNIFFILTAILLMTSCSKQISEKQLNPNNPLTVPPNLILGTVLTDMSGTGTAGRLSVAGSSEGINSWDAAHRWNQYHCSNYDYYDNNVYAWNNGNFDPYLVLKNVMQMEKEVITRTPAAVVNPYETIGRFVRAYYFYNLTSLFGDVPQTQALESVQDFTPAYTPQLQVFAYVLNQLDTANTHITSLIAAGDNTLSTTQDIYYGGDLKKWQKLINSYKLRVLVSLSAKATDATLQVPAQFANIINNPGKYPIFAGTGDDMQLVYNPGGNNSYTLYPLNPSNFGSIGGRDNLAKAYVSAATAINDPRIFVTGEPAWALVGHDTAAPCKFQYFAGASTGESLATMYANANAGDYSFFNRKRYYSNFTGDPDVLVGYKEMCFNIAEAITRGWIAGNAETWYKTGISASMAFYGIDVANTHFTAFFLPPGNNSVTQVVGFPFTFDFNAYYAQPSVKLSATAATAINQIVLQKYINSFENSGLESYYNWRRTGVPAFDGGNGVGNNGVVPMRMSYPVSEQSQNATNWKTALSNQGFTADDLNQKMTIIK